MTEENKIRTIDINCDMGEGMSNDEIIMLYISSANIACGYHAGDEETMKRTVELAIQNNVAIGAHPSFFDKENFGRKEKQLPSSEIYDLVSEQINILDKIAKEQGAGLSHVKPHGALYNISAKNTEVAKTIAQAVKDFNNNLILFGLSGSRSINEARKIGLKTANEVFADRTYQDDGSLTHRSQQGALIENTDRLLSHVLKMINDSAVIATSGKEIPVVADTICIHGDGNFADLFAKTIYDVLKKENIKIESTV